MLREKKLLQVWFNDPARVSNGVQGHVENYGNLVAF